MTEAQYYKNGRRVETHGFVVRGDDEGLSLGLAVFETLRSCNGRLFRAKAHVQRLADSVAVVGLSPIDIAGTVAELEQAVAGYPTDAKVRITLTGGGARLIEVSSLDQTRVSAPLRVASFPWEPPAWLNGRIKHCSRAMAQVARQNAGVDEIFWVGHDGCFTEAARSNIFAVVGGVLITPPDDGRILCGVTRAALLEVARNHGTPVEEAPLRPDDPMDELYASSTLKNLAPVSELDGAPAPGGGPIGETLSRQFEALLRAECSA